MAEKTIKITESCARTIMRVLDDFCDLDHRANCSNEYFRKHFVMLVTNPIVEDARSELEHAYDAIMTKKE